MIALLLDHLWQSTLFAGGVGLLMLALSANRAAARFWLWFAASMKFLLPFAALAFLGDHFLSAVAPPLQAPALMQMAPVAEPFSGTAPVVAMSGPAIASAVATPVDWTILLLALWAAGFAILCLRWLVRWSRLMRLVHEAVDLEWVAPIAVKSSSSRIEPGLVGIIRPIILLPQGIETQLSAAEMHTILAHELCHWRRRDNLLAAIHMLVEALFWFFPLVWWLGARLNAERERACDESVLAAGGDPTIYAEGILKVCRLYLQSPLPCAAGVSGVGLYNRIDVIMENRLPVDLNGLKKGLLAICAATAIAAPLYLGLLAAPTFPIMAWITGASHPGTEAALRRQIEGWERKQPALDDLTPDLASAVKPTQAAIQTIFDRWGPLKNIIFKENDPRGGDIYLAEFEHGESVWMISPLVGEKIPGLSFIVPEKRLDNGPSPGAAAAMRRFYESLRNGAPAYDLLTAAKIKAVHQQLAGLELNAKNLGALKTLTFIRIDVTGWDVYAATFEKGTSTWLVHPLVNGKLNGTLWTDIHEPGALAHPGTGASLRRYIESLEKGQPDYNEMTPPLAAWVKQHSSELLATVRGWGALKSITFQGGGAEGMDLYDVTFEDARMEWSVAPLTPDGKAWRREFQPL